MRSYQNDLYLFKMNCSLQSPRSDNSKSLQTVQQTGWTDILLSDLALYTLTFIFTKYQSFSPHLIPLIFFCNGTVSKSKSSCYFLNDFYGHFKSPHSLHLSPSPHIRSFRFWLFHVIFYNEELRLRFTLSSHFCRCCQY